MRGELRDVFAVNFGGDRANQRMLGLDGIAVGLERLADLLPQAFIGNRDDDFDGLRAASHATAHGGVGLRPGLVSVRTRRRRRREQEEAEEEAHRRSGIETSDGSHAGEQSKGIATGSAVTQLCS